MRLIDSKIVMPWTTSYRHEAHRRGEYVNELDLLAGIQMELTAQKANIGERCAIADRLRWPKIGVVDLGDHLTLFGC
jgi:hypothetical protein